jgi:hypothetical protein
MSSVHIRSFHIHGIDIQVETDIPQLSRGVTELLGKFPQASNINGNSLTVVCGTAEGRETGNRKKDRHLQGERLYTSSPIDMLNLEALGIKLDVWCDGPSLLLDFHRHGWLLLDPEQGTLEGCLTEPITLHHQIVGSLFFLMPLSRLLASRGLYLIHAAALERNGRGVLMPGVSRSGKSTSCVALMRAGYRCLSDDKPFLRGNSKGIELLAFPEKLDVTDQTVSFIPELCTASTALTPGYRKKQFHPEAIYPGSTVNAVQPDLILFPRISGESASRLERLPKATALEMILPHSLLVFDRTTSADHFQLLARLVAGADCYRLHFGHNVLDLPRLIDPLLG